MNFWQGLTQPLIDFICVILSVLPTDPLASVFSSSTVTQYLGYVNFFIPIGQMVTVTTAWLGAIALYYGISVILRWLKAIE